MRSVPTRPRTLLIQRGLGFTVILWATNDPKQGYRGTVQHYFLIKRGGGVKPCLGLTVLFTPRLVFNKPVAKSQSKVQAQAKSEKGKRNLASGLLQKSYGPPNPHTP